MNYLIKIVSILMLILLICIPAAYAKGAHVSAHSSSHVSVHSSSHVSTPESRAKTYTTPPNIKTSKVQEASNYHNYSSTNVFRPNFWTAMWAFQCMHDNTEEVTEQDIAKELEERGYTQEEIDKILAEGRELQTKNEGGEWAAAILIGLLLVLFFILIIVACW